MNSPEIELPYLKVAHSEEESLEEAKFELFGLSDDSTLNEKVYVLVKQAAPVVLSFFLLISGNFVNLIFAGQYADSAIVLAGISLSNLFTNVTCLSILVGMTSSIETLCSYHNGAKNFREVGVVLQRSIIILGIVSIPIMFLWTFAGSIFLAMGIERRVCHIISVYVRIRTLTVPLDVMNESYRKYLLAIGVPQPTMYANIAFNALLLGLDFMFVNVFHLGFECLAWAWVISIYCSAALQFLLSYHHPSVQRTLQPWTREALSNWKEFINLGLPGTIMLCSEWWAYEFLTMFASVLGTEEVAAQTIVINTASLTNMIPLGMSITATTLVGNALGAKREQLAVELGKFFLCSIMVVEVFIGLGTWFGGKYFVALFTGDEWVQRIAERAIPILCLCTITDGFQGVLAGIIRGTGKQFIGAITNLTAYYAIGLPMAWYLCFRCGLNVNGLILGIGCGAIFQVVVLMTLVLAFERYIYHSSVKEVPETEAILIAEEKDVETSFTDDADGVEAV